ncbi:recombination protein NinG, partial [Providencia vermicola]
IPYRINLINKIGEERVKRLEHDNSVRKFDIEYLKRMKSIFTRRARWYEKRRKQLMEAA